MATLVIVIVIIAVVVYFSRPGNPLKECICPNPNCKYQGKPIKKAKGSFFVGLILCCFFLLPGILYFMIKSGYRYYCPNCSMQIRED